MVLQAGRITIKNPRDTLLVYTSSTIDRLRRERRGRFEGSNGSVAVVGQGRLDTVDYFIYHWNWERAEGRTVSWRWFSATAGNANASLTKRSLLTARLCLARPLNRPVFVIDALCIIRTRVSSDRYRRTRVRTPANGSKSFFAAFVSDRL